MIHMYRRWRLRAWEERLDSVPISSWTVTEGGHTQVFYGKRPELTKKPQKMVAHYRALLAPELAKAKVVTR